MEKYLGPFSNMNIRIVVKNNRPWPKKQRLAYWVEQNWNECMGTRVNARPKVQEGEQRVLLGFVYL
jgi:hypothetical protein